MDRPEDAPRRFDDTRCFECAAPEGSFHAYPCEVEASDFHRAHLRYDEPSLQRMAARRFPYIAYPFRCGRCGAPYPALFMVADEVWAHYIEPRQRKEMFCRACFDAVVRLVDASGKPRPDWCGSPYLRSVFLHYTCTKPKGHGGRVHGCSGSLWYRAKGQLYPDDAAAEAETP